MLIFGRKCSPQEKDIEYNIYIFARIKGSKLYKLFKRFETEKVEYW